MAGKTEGASPDRPGSKRQSPFYNTTSIIGFWIAGLTLALVALLYALEVTTGGNNPYVGLISFVGLPPILIIGLILGFWGAYRTHKRMKKGEATGALPRIDFNDRHHRKVFSFFALGGLAFMAISAFGSYQVYEYTDSVHFCGEVCHGVMKAEYTAYQYSPHSQVKCTECHVASGADGYVRAKLNGAHQVLAAMQNNFKRPITTPIKDQRAVDSACTKCHSPGHFYAQKLKDRTYYAQDEANSKFQMSMLMKIGGNRLGATEGIHAHMYIDQEITYIATDPQRQVIPYVEMRDKNGKVTVYRSTEDEITEEMIENGKRRVVGCIDCHNRPSHRFPHPANSVNLALSKGWIDPALPDIKRIAIEALEKEYKNESEALASFQKEITAEYQKDYAQAFAEKKPQLDTAIKFIGEIYKRSYFPEMKASWQAFPDNADHMYSKGCFRCHDDKHVSADGRKISMDCNSCHTILSYKSADGKETSNRGGLAFMHPTDIGDAWKTTLCKDCHAPSD